ncbi:glycosyl hydrolase family 61-domain-containing protein [Aspergillus undulatus]|uniref:glycosyl hydrolase family 61-domain-containing protein n=1 Tax=Aspergillus undulatus TaxID=1810928 RepID=UPI003CCD0432
MKTGLGLLALAAGAQLAAAHATVMAVWINDEDQGLGNGDDGYIRSPPNNNPVQDVTSTDMTCNVNGKTAAAKTLEVAAGDKITFEWHHNGRSDSDDIIASSHKGPVMVYMAPTEKGTAGNGWVKLYENGYDASSDTWAVDTLIEDKGKHSVIVPDVPAGNYLFRPEIIALHSASSEGGAQFYLECVQFKVTSDGSETLPEGVSIPGTYKADDPGILINIYSGLSDYEIPGPAVWTGSAGGGMGTEVSGSSGSSGSASSAAATTSAAEKTAVSSAAPTTSAAAPTTTVAAVQTQTQAQPTSFATAVKPTTTAAAAPTSTVAPAPSTSSGASTGTGSVQEYQQCGGLNFKGATGCEAGLTCKQWNPYYFQCVKA